MSIAHNKHLNPLLNLLVNCVSAKSKLVKNGNCSFYGVELIVYDNPLPAVFLSKKNYNHRS